MNDGDFSIETFNERLKQTYIDITEPMTPLNAPRAFILGGQPGAGKTGLQEIMSNQCSGNLIIINGDEFRELHPDFKYLQEKYGKDSVDYTGKFSGKMTESLIKKLKSDKYNVLVEGTLRTSEVPLNTCRNFKESGYSVTLGIMAVKPEISYISTIFRYEKMLEMGKFPRATAKDKHDYVVAKIPENLKEIYDSKQFDNIVIYNREGECLYDMSANVGITPDTVMDEMFTGQWTQKELNQFIEIGKITQQLMEKRNAEELADFKNNIFNDNIISAIAQNNGLSYRKKPDKASDKIQGDNAFFIPIENPKQLEALRKSGIPFKINKSRTVVIVNIADKEKAKKCISESHAKQNLHNPKL